MIDLNLKYSRMDTSANFSLYTSLHLGKKVYGSLYVHKSLIEDTMKLVIKPSAKEMFAEIKTAVDASGWEYDIIVFRKGYKIFNDGMVKGDVQVKGIEFVKCPTWDTEYEPTVGDRLNVYASLLSFKSEIKKAPKNNPQIFHRRHLFTHPDYNGFNRIDDVLRVEQWSALGPNKRRMGRRDWWDKFLAENNLEK